MTARIINADCRDAMRAMDADSIDAIVCDPPYGLEFMGKSWDKLDLGWQAGGGFSKPGIGERSTEWASFSSTSRFGAANPTCATCGGRLRGAKKCTCSEPEWKPIGKRRNPENDGLPNDVTGGGMARQMSAMQDWHYAWAVEALRVLKPGGHLLAFGGDRTVHRLACAIEDAGFEIRGQIAWIYGQGFPKNLNVSKALAGSLPVDALCVCAHDSTRTIQGSQCDCPSCRDSDDAQPHADQAVDLDAAPLPSDVHGRSRGDRPVDAPAQAQASIFPDAEISRRASEDYQRPLERRSTGCRSSDSKLSDTQASTSRVAQTAPHKTGPNTRCTPDSAFDSAASSSWRNSNLPQCSECGKIRVRGGLGTALKPAMELVVLARKPLRGTVAANVQKFGTGALNIDGCRIGTADDLNGGAYGDSERQRDQYASTDSEDGAIPLSRLNRGIGEFSQPLGRWPANVIHDGSDEVVALFPAEAGACAQASGPQQSGPSKSGSMAGAFNGMGERPAAFHADSGSAARFFYTAKASASDRNDGLHHLPRKRGPEAGGVRTIEAGSKGGYGAPRANHHPTVKPTDLMRYLCRLVTPPEGLILDPFCGSGSTGKAALLEGFNFVGIELDAEYAALARERIYAAAPLFAGEVA